MVREGVKERWPSPGAELSAGVGPDKVGPWAGPTSGRILREGKGRCVMDWKGVVLAAALAVGGATGARGVARQVDIVYTSDVRGTVGICG